MPRTALTAIAFISLAAASANAETKPFDVSNFDSIDVSAAIDVYYEPGPAAKVLVEQEDGDFSDILIEQEGGTLVIGRHSLQKKRFGHTNISITNRLGHRIVKVNGKRVPNYTLHITGPMISEVSVARSSELNIQGLDAALFEGRVMSSGELTIEGRANEARLSASSSGDLDATELVTASLETAASSSADLYAQAGSGDLKIDASSSADIEIDVTGALASVQIDASSSADVTLSGGTCAMMTLHASSSADIDASEVSCESGDIEASSGADVVANITSVLTARASSGADIEIDGDPAQRNIKESSGGDIDIG